MSVTYARVAYQQIQSRFRRANVLPFHRPAWGGRFIFHPPPLYLNSDRQWEGAYVEGKRYGEWGFRRSDRTTQTEEKSQIEQEMMENEATLAEAKQKAARVALWEQKLTTFEELYNEATPEERKDLLRLHINYLIYTPDGIQLALFDPSTKADRPKVQRDGTSGSGGRTRTYDPMVNSHLLCQLSYAGTSYFQ